MTRIGLFLFAVSAFGSTIPVTGAGSFVLDNWMDGNAQMFFSGSNGADSVSFGGDIPLGFTEPTSLEASSLNAPWLQAYSATIDGVTSDFWSFSLEDGLGIVEIFDSAGDVLESQDISGVVQTTSYWEFESRWIVVGSILNDDWEASGTFVIGAADPVETPEAGSGVLVGLGLLAAFLRVKRAL